MMLIFRSLLVLTLASAVLCLRMLTRGVVAGEQILRVWRDGGTKPKKPKASEIANAVPTGSDCNARPRDHVLLTFVVVFLRRSK